MNTQHRRLTQRGFTLVELLTVITIIAVLLTLSVAGGTAMLHKAKISKCHVQVNLIQNRLQEFEADNGEFPPGNGSASSSIEIYEALYENGRQDSNEKIYLADLDPEASNQFKRQILEDGTIIDTFKHKKPYYYLRGIDENGEEEGDAYNPDFDLWSLGPNGIGRGDGASGDDEDDITNWDG